MVAGGVAAAAAVVADGSIVTPFGLGVADGCVSGGDVAPRGGRLLLRRGGGEWSVGVHGLGCGPRRNPGGGAFVSGIGPCSRAAGGCCCS